jgi:hypothetical protein
MQTSGEEAHCQTILSPPRCRLLLHIRLCLLLFRCRSLLIRYRLLLRRGLFRLINLLPLGIPGKLLIMESFCVLSEFGWQLRYLLETLAQKGALSVCPGCRHVLYAVVGGSILAARGLSSSPIARSTCPNS